MHLLVILELFFTCWNSFVKLMSVFESFFVKKLIHNLNCECTSGNLGPKLYNSGYLGR